MRFLPFRRRPVSRCYRLACHVNLADLMRPQKPKRRFRIRQDGWVRHDGGPCPVPADTRVQCWFRCSTAPPFFDEKASMVPESWWRHGDGKWDVIWFRPVAQRVAAVASAPPVEETVNG